MRAILDTNVVVSALIWGGTPFKLLQTAIDQEIVLYTSPALLAELHEVLTREHLARRLTQQQTSVDEAFRLYDELTLSVTPLAIPRSVPNDIDDDQVIAVALAAGAELIVSGDQDLLMMHPWRGIQILNAADALQWLLGEKTSSRK